MTNTHYTGRGVLATILAQLLLMHGWFGSSALAGWIDPPGLLPNGDFETGTTENWSTTGGSVVDDNGGKALNLTGTAGGANATYANRVRLSSSRSYLVSFQTKVIQRSPSGTNRLQEYTADTGGTLGFNRKTSFTNTIWTNFQIRIGPSSDTLADVHFSSGAGWGGDRYLEVYFNSKDDPVSGGYWSWTGQMRIDNVAVIEVPPRGTVVTVK